MARAILAIWIGAFLAAGCTALQAPPEPWSDGAPVVVRDRSALPDCGWETVRSDGDANVPGRRCLWSAYQEHRPAEFVTTQWSIEGDPITSIYRVLPGGAVEVFIDSTHDAWSARTWLHLACPDLVPVDVSSGQPAFGPGSDCIETTIR